MRKLSCFFGVLALVLSHAMFAFVAYEFGYLTACRWTSFPAYTAFFYAIPFFAGILVCSVLSLVFLKKSQNESSGKA